MLEQGRIALLFDGSDELALRVTYAKAAEHFSTLLQAAAGTAKVVLTSRRQHFLTENDVRTPLAQQVEAVTGRRLSGREVKALTGHQKTVWGVAFSLDGKSLATGSSDNTLRLWTVDSGREIRTLTGHHHAVWSVAFSPDGKSLASGSFDGTIRLWKVADGRCLAVLLPLPEGWVAYSPDGRYKFGGVPAGGFWHVASLCRFEIGELDNWIPGLRLADDTSFFDLPPWKPGVVVPQVVNAEESRRDIPGAVR